jgi:hypothetical protein
MLNKIRSGTERPPGCFGIFRDFQSTPSVGNPHFPQPFFRITQQKERFPKTLAQTSLLSMEQPDTTGGDGGSVHRHRMRNQESTVTADNTPFRALRRSGLRSPAI